MDPRDRGGAFAPCQTPPKALSVLSYNVFLRAPVLLFFRDRHRQRVRELPSLLRRFDIIVLQEAFASGHRRRLRVGLLDSHPHATRVVGRGGPTRLNGGVMIVSRWPIEAEAQRTFGSLSAGIDTLADKGIVYACVRRGWERVHVFGIHAQVGVEHRAVRRRQLLRLKAFVDESDIPATEPVLLAGDFNVDMRTDDRDGEYAEMKRLLEAAHPELPAGASRTPTQDGLHNELVRYDFRKHLDYVLYSTAHLHPERSFTEIHRLQAQGRDLSDHYAVHGTFHFPGADRAG